MDSSHLRRRPSDTPTCCRGKVGRGVGARSKGWSVSSLLMKYRWALQQAVCRTCAATYAGGPACCPGALRFPPSRPDSACAPYLAAAVELRSAQRHAGGQTHNQLQKMPVLHLHHCFAKSGTLDSDHTHMPSTRCEPCVCPHCLSKKHSPSMTQAHRLAYMCGQTARLGTCAIRLLSGPVPPPPHLR